MNDSNSFTYRYAIRRPDGDLVLQPKNSDLEFFKGMLGRSSGDDDEPRKPRTWDTREAAETALQQFKQKAADLGIGEWFGRVEQQLCTPFTVTDPAEHFADEIQQWLQGGAE